MLNKVSSGMGMVIENCHIIFVTHPAFRLKQVVDQMLSYIKNRMNICVVSGTGAEFIFHDCIKKGASLSGLQRVPSVARLERYMCLFGLKGIICACFIKSSKEKSNGVNQRTV